MSKGFGHLTIRKNCIFTDGATVDGGEKEIDSLECWEEYDGYDEE